MNHVPSIPRCRHATFLLSALVATACANDPEEHLATFTLETSPSQIEVVMGEEEESPVSFASQVEYGGNAYTIGDLVLTSSNPAVVTMRPKAEGNGLVHEPGHFNTELPDSFDIDAFRCPDGHFCYWADGPDRGQLYVKCHQAGTAAITIDGTLHVFEREQVGRAKHTVPASTSFEVTCVVKTSMGPGCDSTLSEPVNLLGEVLLDEASWCDTVDLDVDTEPTVHSSNEVASKPGAGDHTEIWGRVAEGITITQEMLDAGAADLLACGDNERGRTLCADPQVPVLTGEWLVLANVAHGRLPDTCTDNLVYGFVLDADGDPSNNYVADPAYPNDWYQDTGRWYEAICDPYAGWSMNARQIVDATPDPLDGIAARITIIDNMAALLVPAAELPSPSGYRMTAFRHGGSYGFDGNWDGDVERPVSAPLLGMPISF